MTNDETLSQLAQQWSMNPSRIIEANNSRDYLVAVTELLRLFGLSRSDVARRQIAIQIAQLDRLYQMIQVRPPKEAGNGQADRN